MKSLCVLALGLLLQACGGGDPPSQPAPDETSACSIASQRQTLRDYMQEQYYWYAQLATPDESAANQDLYFQSMLVKPLDRYSYTQSAASFNQVFTEGRRTGYGYTLVGSDAAQTPMRVRSVEPLSPVAQAGLARGDTVLAIDGLAPAEIAAGQLAVVTTPGVTRSFHVRAASGAERELVVLSGEYALSPVVATAVFDVARDGAPMKVGYIAYNQFVNYSLGQLGLAFIGFEQAGVREVILDLRYNGGGSVATARDLASMLGGSRTAGQLFAYLRFNKKQVARNINVPFNTAETLPLPAGVDRVVVITSGATASASELVINGLRPFVNVVLVGDTTYGKPYGFVARSDCGTVYNAVQFESLNSEGFSAYSAGFAPDCQVPDDLDRQLGDPQEGRIRAALDYVATGRCSAQAPQSLVLIKPKPAQVFGETMPNQMFID